MQSLGKGILKLAETLGGTPGAVTSKEIVKQIGLTKDFPFERER